MCSFLLAYSLEMELLSHRIDLYFTLLPELLMVPVLVVHLFSLLYLIKIVDDKMEILTRKQEFIFLYIISIIQ